MRHFWAFRRGVLPVGHSASPAAETYTTRDGEQIPSRRRVSCPPSPLVAAVAVASVGQTHRRRWDLLFQPPLSSPQSRRTDARPARPSRASPSNGRRWRRLSFRGRESLCDSSRRQQPIAALTCIFAHPTLSPLAPSFPGSVRCFSPRPLSSTLQRPGASFLGCIPGSQKDCRVAGLQGSGCGVLPYWPH